MAGRAYQRVCRTAIGHSDVAEALALDALCRSVSYPVRAVEWREGERKTEKGKSRGEGEESEGGSISADGGALQQLRQRDSRVAPAALDAGEGKEQRGKDRESREEEEEGE